MGFTVGFLKHFVLWTVLYFLTLQINVQHLDLNNIVDMEVAKTDIPYLVHTVKERWIQRFPLLSEIEHLNKT